VVRSAGRSATPCRCARVRYIARRAHAGWPSTARDRSIKGKVYQRTHVLPPPPLGYDQRMLCSSTRTAPPPLAGPRFRGGGGGGQFGDDGRAGRLGVERIGSATNPFELALTSFSPTPPPALAQQPMQLRPEALRPYTQRPAKSTKLQPQTLGPETLLPETPMKLHPEPLHPEAVPRKVDDFAPRNAAFRKSAEAAPINSATTTAASQIAEVSYVSMIEHR
jgi:hypothetical protein